MKRGTIIISNNEYYIFLSVKEDIANCAVVEDVMDEFEGYSCARVTSLKKIPVNEIKVAETYPNYFNQINIT